MDCLERPLRMAFVTVGDTGRLTGGYLYHREVFARLRARGLVVDEVVVSAASLEAQLAAAAGLGRAFDPAPYDIIVVDALARAVCAPWLDAWRARRPLVAMVHELPSVAGGADPGAEAREEALLRADRLITVSDDGAAILVARGVDPARIVVAPGGLDRLGPPAQSSAGAPPSRSQSILCVAQWIPRKGILELVRAWTRAARPGWRLELLGEEGADPLYAEAVRAAIGAAPAGTVGVRGAVTDAQLAEAFAEASIFAMPSRYEGYGIAFAEALCFGLPIVGCAVGPVPALVGPDAGLLVPPGDEDALAMALAGLIDDGALRRRMAAAALARAATLPTWDGCADAFLGAVRSAAGRS